jgi:uncharacterized protein YjeT (DUF2065 family)
MRSVEFVDFLSGIVVAGFCLFLIGLAALIVTMPSRAERFLRAFAGSARAHYTEQGLRLVVGISIVNLASSMRYPELFRLFGWLIVVTTVGLLLMPWQWHRKFGSGAMPLVLRHMRLFALGAVALAVFILYGFGH